MHADIKVNPCYQKGPKDEPTEKKRMQTVFYLQTYQYFCYVICTLEHITIK